jgi:hypothetical protein
MDIKYQEALAANKMPTEKKTSLATPMKSINFVDARHMNSRIFHVLWKQIPYRSEVDVKG